MPDDTTESRSDDEQALLDALRRSDHDAFRDVFATHADRLYRLAVGVLGDSDDAEDAVQEAFISLARHLDQFDGRARLGTWLYRVTYNEALQRLRRPDRQPDRRPVGLEATGDRLSGNAGADPEASARHAELRRELDRALSGLSDGLRAAYLLRDVEGLSTAEAADSLEVSESALKVRLHRARQAVREAIAPDVLPPTTSVAGLTCEAALGRLDDYLDGSLAEAPRRQLEAHVELCDHCRITVDTAHRSVELAGAHRTWVIPERRSTAMFDRLARVFSARM